MSNYIINFTDPLKGNFVIRPYTSNGPKFPTTSVLNDTSIAANSTLLLYGKSHPEYGERTDENLLNLLENFAGATEPVIKVGGMLWHKEVLYYRDSGTGTFYVYTTSWNSITLFGTGALPNPATPPVGLVDGDYWYDNTGSPTILYQWSSDERNIDNWIVRLFDEAAGVPSAAPVKEVQIYDGDAWDVLPDLTAVNALITASVASYLLLDTSNGPLTGDLEISKNDPTLTLTSTGSPTFPLIDLVGDSATVRLRGTVNWSMADNADTIEFRVGNTPGANLHFVIDNVNDYLTHGNNQTAAQYRTNIAGVDNAIPNKLYVDGLVTGAITGDTFVDGGTFAITSVGSPAVSTGTLTMPYSTTGSPGPAGDLVITDFDSDNIPFVTGLVGLSEPATTVDDALTKAAPIESPLFTGAPLSPNLIPTDPSTQIANKGYVDNAVAAGVATASSAGAALRDVQVGGGTLFTLPFNYTAGDNRLMVFKNGVKQYKDELASSTATFSPALSGDQTLTGLDVYTIVGVSPGEGSPLGTNTWTISGLHASEFTAGDTFDVILNGDPASEITYTVSSAAATPGSPSPGTTDIVVVGGSPIGIPQTALPSGFIGINYEFQLTMDGVTNTITPVNVVSDPTVNNLITQMQAGIDAAFGAGEAAVYLHGGNIRVDSLRLTSGSPTPTISLGNGITSADSDLFDTNNLVVDGFAGSFTSGAVAIWAYVESDGAGGIAPSNTSANNIEFNVTTLGTDTIEFLLV